MLTTKPRGTKDIYSPEIYTWQWLENILREISHLFGMSEIRTPTFEHTELFVKNIGDTTDVVNKEMYTFDSKAGKSLTLRPEGTAGVARAFIENKVYGGTLPARYYYIGNFFRYEKPQAGRYREFNSFGVEIIGSRSPVVDAEIISLGSQLLSRLGINNISLHINCIGEDESRKIYHGVLKSYLEENVQNLCPDCVSRMAKNPLRALDCKVPSCKEIMKNSPLITDYLTEEDGNHFSQVCKLLDKMEIKYVIDPKIVRGLDYYTRTVFEFISQDIGAQGTVIGGGRYDKMIAESGGPDMGACGFGMGMERLVMVLENGGLLPDIDIKPTIYVGCIGEEGLLKASAIVHDLRQKGIYALGENMGRGVKAQLKYANKIKARFSLVIGDDEINTCKANVKNMETGETYNVELGNLAEFLTDKGE